MARLIILWLASFLALSTASNVIELTKDNFEEKTKDREIMLVEFYAPWCGHCKALAPEYEGAADELIKDDVPIAKVNCDDEKDLCTKYGVGGFPTLKIFRNGEFSKDYDGGRKKAEIVKHMRGQAGPSSLEVKTQTEMDNFLAKSDFVIFGCFDHDSKHKETYLKVASAERENYRFGHTTDKDLVTKHKCKDSVTVYQPEKFHSKFEPTEFKYTGEIDAKGLKEFLKASTLGLCPVRDTGNSERFTYPLIVVYYNVDYDKDPKGTHYWRNRVLKVAQQFKAKVKFAISNKDAFAHELDEHGLGEKKTSDKPLVAAMSSKGQKFPMSSEFSVDNLIQFAKDFLDDKLEPYLKSEPIPEQNDEPLKVVVAKNFDELVNDPSRDVLIEFYAPWCGHCKQLAPKYEKLAEKLKNEPGVRIVKMDATANDVPKPFEVSGFPTLYWVPKNDKANPVRYNGGREIKDFINYIAEKATDELDGYSRDGKKKKDEKEVKEEL